MQNVVETVYMQASNEKEALTTIIAQHMTIIEQFRSAEDRGCLDLDQYQEIRTELHAINKSLHILTEEHRDLRTTPKTH